MWYLGLKPQVALGLGEPRTGDRAALRPAGTTSGVSGMAV